MTDATNSTPGLSDADIDRLLGLAVVPPPSTDFTGRIVAAAARASQTDQRPRRPGTRRKLFRRTTLRGAIVFAAAAATAAAAALTAVRGDVRRLPDIPEMIFHTRHHSILSAHRLATARADAPTRSVSAAPPEPVPPLSRAPDLHTVQQPAEAPLVQQRVKLDERRESVSVRARRSVVEDHVARDDAPSHAHVAARDDAREIESPHIRATETLAPPPTHAADHHETVQPEKLDRVSAPEAMSERAGDAEDRTDSQTKHPTTDPWLRPGDGDKQRWKGFRGRGLRHPFGRMGRF